MLSVVWNLSLDGHLRLHSRFRNFDFRLFLSSCPFLSPLLFSSLAPRSRLFVSVHLQCLFAVALLDTASLPFLALPLHAARRVEIAMLAGMLLGALHLGQRRWR